MIGETCPVAVQHFVAAVAAAPAVSAPWLRMEQGDTLRRFGDISAAEAVYQALLQDAPSSWQAVAGLGRCAWQRRDLQLTGERFTAALKAAPLPPPRWLRLEYGSALREQGRAQEAEAQYRALLDDEGGAWSWEALAGLAHCAHLRNDLSAAVEYFAVALSEATALQRARAVDSDLFIVHVEQQAQAVADTIEQGLAFKREGRSNDAIACFQQALSLEPKHHACRIALANLLGEQGRLNEAEGMYRALLDDEPHSWQASAGLGQCARLRGTFRVRPRRWTPP